jgi:hypothetical protein
MVAPKDGFALVVSLFFSLFFFTKQFHSQQPLTFFLLNLIYLAQPFFVGS